MIPTIEMIPATEMTPNHHRNDPHHRNDTGGHHRNDPRNIRNGIKGTRKTGQQFSACFLFIYIASFLRCAIYLLPHFILYFIFNKIVLKQNKSNCAIRLCLPDDIMTTVMTSVKAHITTRAFQLISVLALAAVAVISNH